THQFDQDDAEAERDQKLILMRARVKMADDDALDQYADDHDKKRSRDHRRDERPGVAVGQPAGIAAEHEHGAMREIEDAERAIDDGEARGDQRKQRAEHQPVETLRNEIGPIDHGSATVARKAAPQAAKPPAVLRVTPGSSVSAEIAAERIA